MYSVDRVPKSFYLACQHCYNNSFLFGDNVMKFSKFFAVALVASSSVFVGSNAFAGDDHSMPNPSTPPTPSCECATSASVIETKGGYGPNVFAASLATGKYGAATIAGLGKDGAAFTGGAASNRMSGKLDLTGSGGGTTVTSIVN
jgi:hypothetical protein